MRGMPFPTLVSAIAHEMAHVVLESTYHPLRENEKVVDLTAMLFGYSELYVKGVRIEERNGNTITTHHFGYLSLPEVQHAASLMKKLRGTSRQTDLGSKCAAVFGSFAAPFISMARFYQIR
jgi:hypothetical protein